MCVSMWRFSSLKSNTFSSKTNKPLNYVMGSGKIKDGCCFMPKSGWVNYAEKSGRLGYNGTPPHPGGAQWIIPIDDGKRLIDKSKGNVGYIMHKLGIPMPPRASVLDYFLAVINPVALWNLRMPTADTPGANAQFVPGGETSGGITERVIDQI